MQITVHLDTQDKTDLAALAALVAALGGRVAPTVTEAGAPLPVANGGTYATNGERPAPPAPETPKDAAEMMLQREAARVAAAPPPPADGDDNSGPAVDPKTIDKDGIPWDVRIHSTPPKINADGTWRKKRGLSEVTYGEIHAELQAAQVTGNHGTGTTNTATGPNGSGTVETPAAPPPPASSAPTASAPPPPPPADVPNAPAPPSASTVPPAAESAPGGGSPPAGRFAGFPEFVQAVNSIRTPTIPYLELNTYAETVCGAGVQFKDLKDRPDAWETFYAVAGGQ